MERRGRRCRVRAAWLSRVEWRRPQAQKEKFLEGAEEERTQQDGNEIAGQGSGGGKRV